MAKSTILKHKAGKDVVEKLRGLHRDFVVKASEANLAQATFQHEVTMALAKLDRPGKGLCLSCGIVTEPEARCTCNVMPDNEGT